MSSLFTLFCCCGQRRPVRLAEDVNETTHLIPSDIEQNPCVCIPPVFTIVHAGYTDNERMQERLLTIVRAKERKMVNVNSQIPFNLHNRVITPNPSLSRSVSLSNAHRDHAAVAFSALEPLTVQLRAPPSPLDSGSNPSGSSRSISRPRNPLEALPPEPVLNVRLVNATLPQRVGRPRHRAYGSQSSTERPNTRPPGTQGVSVPDSPPTITVPAPSPTFEPLNEICLSWGDSDE
ncbi:hypothetical protein FB45DRAFT_520886 [Roridomyces roridus]|uniref:Uncharacterized protein n=1 Tax=Roridomyces roridus TaxID=1738132 RepID=A0AAD7BXC6_9AGAR|nr:hypothetical protein FB45DRAFT_520886 [Roridomyces roridus]